MKVEGLLKVAGPGCRVALLTLLWHVQLMVGQAGDANVSPQTRLGERLFSDSHFSPAVLQAKAAVSCRTCHFVYPPTAGSRLSHSGTSTFADHAALSTVPPRDESQSTTVRNSPSLVESLSGPKGSLFHFDGEFATAEDLVAETFTGRNFGWLPGERAEARRHFVRAIRNDPHREKTADEPGFSYAELLRGTDERIPLEWRLPATARVDVEHATDDEIIQRCAELVVAFVQSLQFSRDAAGLHDGSPYDAFLTENRLARAPRSGESPREYARRLGEQAAALRAPRFIDVPARRLREHDQPFRFGEEELRGMQIFFRGAVGASQSSGAGNCAECHVPPQFTDFKFHNTGVAQEDYDAEHGAGAFMKLAIPALGVRNAEPQRWLPATAHRPGATGIFLSVPRADAPGRADLGLWNIYANADFPASQPAFEKLFNPAGLLSRDDVLAGSIGRFKTSMLRDLGQSAPYFHSGRAATLEETIAFYQRQSVLAQRNELRNAPPEFFAMRLGSDDTVPLAAFLRALNEDFPRSPR